MSHNVAQASGLQSSQPISKEEMSEPETGTHNTCDRQARSAPSSWPPEDLYGPPPPDFEEFWASLPDHIRQYDKYRKIQERERRCRGRAHILLNAARGRGRQKGIPVTVTMSWICQRLRAGVCEATGLPFRYSGEIGVRGNFSPSLDRISSAEGYTTFNCQVVIWAYNAAKGAGTDADVLRMAEALVRRKALENGNPER